MQTVALWPSLTTLVQRRETQMHPFNKWLLPRATVRRCISIVLKSDAHKRRKKPTLTRRVTSSTRAKQSPLRQEGFRHHFCLATNQCPNHHVKQSTAPKNHV